LEVLLEPLVTSELLDELLLVPVPVLLLTEVDAVEAPVEALTATIAPVAASEPATAPPMIIVRARPTLRVLRVRASFGSMSVPLPGDGSGGQEPLLRP
jgi:hypothetical protein